MPNWTQNRVEISGPDAELETVKAWLASEGEPFDFNKVEPMPPILLEVVSPVCLGENGRPMLNKTSEQPFKMVEATEAEAALLATIPDPSWYEWALAHWGTKWTACHADPVEHEPGQLVYRFDTAWDAPRALLVKLCEKMASVAPHCTLYATARHEDDGYEAEEITFDL